MKKFLNSVLTDIAIIWEIIKSFIIMTLVVIAIFTALAVIVHNVLKIREVYSEDTSGYKNLVSVDNNRMNVYVEGTGDKTIVILSNFGNPSPIIQYKTYIDRLVSNNYRVAVVEYFGYGYSLSTKNNRNIGYIVHEINEALTISGINGPYTILANGTSGIYAESYVNNFPDLVDRLVLIDSIYPETIKEEYMKKYIADRKTNITITSVAELTGYARLLSYIKPETFGIDKMKEYGFSTDDIATYRKMIASRFYTKTMRKEYKALPESMELFKDYRFPEYLNVSQILSDEYIEEYSKYKEEKLLSKDVKEYAEDLITNPEIQKIYIVEGKKDNLNLYNPDGVVNTIINN